MSRISKSLLLACLVAFGVGLYVSFTKTPLTPVWTLALPVAAILYGLFLITLVFRHAFARPVRADRETRTETQSAEPRKSPPTEIEARDGAAGTSHRPAYS